MVAKAPDKELERLPPCAIDFLRLVIKKMRYRKKVRAEVMAELTAHFQDELKDCKSNEEKEQRAEKLIADFGDVKLLGVLLRRAKKRCRPLWRIMVARTFQTIGVLTLCLVAYVVWFLTGKPVITTDYLAQLNQIVRPVANESLNAAPLYEKATELYGKRWDDIAELRSKRRNGLTPEQHELIMESPIPVLLSKYYDEVTPKEKQRIRKWLANNKEIFDLLIAGTEKPYYWPKYETGRDTKRMMAVRLPELNRFRKLAHALRRRGWLRAEQGRYEEAFGDLKSCYRFGRHIKGDNTFLIEQLVGIAIEALATQRLRDILSEYEIDSTALAALQKDFEQMVASEDFTVSFEAEKLSMYDEIQRSFTDGPGGGHIIPKHIAELVSEVQVVAGLSGSIGSPSSTAKKSKPGWLSERISDIKDTAESLAMQAKIVGYWIKKRGHILFFHPNKQQTLKATEQLYDYWESMNLKSPAQIRAEGIDTEDETLEVIKGNLLLGILMPAWGRIIELSHNNKTGAHATVTILGLLRYKNDKGYYPESMQELVTAGYLSELPMDSWSDKPLIYKKTDDDFILYSVGENFEDDGGEVIRDYEGRVRRTWQRKGDAVFWPVPKPETPQETEERLKKERERRRPRRRSKRGDSPRKAAGERR